VGSSGEVVGEEVGEADFLGEGEALVLGVEDLEGVGESEPRPEFDGVREVEGEPVGERDVEGEGVA